MKFGVLGPLEVYDGDRPITITTGKVRALLAALLLRANRVVATDALIDQLWGHAPPANPRSTLQTSVQRLRRALGKESARLLHTRPDGYQITVEPKQLDLLWFRELVQDARRTDDLRHCRGLLSEALALWRGQPLAGLAWESLLREELPALLEELLAVQEQLLDVRLALGQHAEVVAELTALTGRYPLRERLWAQLMLALYRCDRQADALQAYRAVTRRLADELGIDPNQQLQRLHHAILLADPSLAVPAGPPLTVPIGPPSTASVPWYPPPARSWSPQSQLPLDTHDLVGRAELVDRISGLLIRDRGVPVVWLSGAPGIGKTALAIRVGHRLRPAYPDGQWYLRLDGVTNPRDPHEILAELLHTAGVEQAELPHRLDARAAALRARLADRRVLLLLDDAASAEQVQPLLPGTLGCAVLVTSRHDLPGLTAHSAACGIRLDVLTPDDAKALLAGLLGSQLGGSDAAELAELCGYLPLALRIAAANLTRRPATPLARYVAELRGGNRLARLALPGGAALRTAYDQSYDQLPPSAQRLLRLLGLVGREDVTADAVAALLNTSVEHAETLLDTLATANLLQRHGADRYRLNGLVRLYAAEHATRDPERHTAWQRLHDRRPTSFTPC